jgi:site-specific recombinase XerD
MQSVDRETLGLIEEFIAQAEVRENTHYKYRVHLHEYVRWLAHIGERRAVDATPGDVRRYMAYLKGGDRFAARQHHRIEHDLSPSARKNMLSSIHSFYRYLVSVEIIQVDPSTAVRPPRVTVKPGLHLSAPEIRALLDAPGNDARERIVVYLLVYTGTRADELRGLLWRDVDMQERTLTVRGKGGKFRVLDIHPALMAELRRWWLRQDVHQHRHLAMRDAMQDPERAYVLLTRTGNQLAKTVIAKHVKARAARIGLRPKPSTCHRTATEVSPHALRRSFATLLLNDGHHIDAVADVLGHASIDTTRTHYAFASNARRRATIEAFHV